MEEQKPTEIRPTNASADDSISQLDNGQSLEAAGDEPTTGGATQSANNASVTPLGNSSTPTVSSTSPGLRPLSFWYRLWEHLNIYLLIFLLLIVVATATVVVLYFKRQTQANVPATISQQKLSSDALQKLADSGVQVGDPQQVLNIQSNAVFNNQVLIKGELQVAGGLKIGGGNLTIPGLSVSGSGSIGDLQTRSLAVAGDTAVQGQLTVQKNLSVNGSGTFNGPVSATQITTGKLQLSGDLQITRHLTAGGGIPGRSNGSALGSGGTSSVSGSDTAGSISINTGSSAGAGCFITVNFTQPFSTTPHINITPVGSAAAGISYYINRSTTNFSVCTTSAPPSNQSFGFDYFAVD